MDIKQVDKYKAKFKQELNTEGDYINLTISLNTDLKDILKKSCLDGKVPTSFYFGDYDETGNRVKLELQRYKVKSVVYGCLYQDYKDALFITDLIDNGEFTFNFKTLEVLEKFKMNFRDNLFNLLKNVLSSNLEQNIIYKIKVD